MQKLTVYFEAVPHADLKQAAAEIQEKAAALPGVASASAQAMVTRGVGPQEIMMGLKFAAEAVVALTTLVHELNRLADEMPALSKVMVQVGLRKVPVDQLTEHDKLILAEA